ncbi:L,D-transpeptidase family protein [Haliea sp. E17]|uniref:L,D-transpeptidase family protein n=1 Tax=Haliea sp. E17 TaxID=3401576 RepID=UPI003AAFAEEE
MRRRSVLPVLFCLACAGFGARSLAQPPANQPWLLIDTSAMTVSIMRGDSSVKTYDNMAIGSGGTSWDKRRGDGKTPLGEFRILEIRPSARFDLFMAIDYPTIHHALQARSQGDLSDAEFARIESAWHARRWPPQDTVLGGHLGIHGTGAGSLEIHRDINWTDGCIALTNEQVEDLATRIGPGTFVRIR